MSVIIRLQNLPWSANALDIRQFFKGLSIPEGGVHIVGGEMGDAFIAFSTDEDARQAMMKDRGKINEVQIRLLLSSRTEMQKVIETARKQSLLALQKAGAVPITPAAITTTTTTTPLPTPQPPVITTNSLQNILSTQLGAAPSFQTYQQQAGITLTPTPKPKTETSEPKPINRRESNESMSRDRRRSSSRERRRSRSRDRSDRSSGKRRRDRSRSRSRERDRGRKVGRQRSSRRSRSRERSRDHSRDRARVNRDTSRGNRNSKESGNNVSNRFGRDNIARSVRNVEPKESSSGKAAISQWSGGLPMNAYETSTRKSVPNDQTQQKPTHGNSYSTTPEVAIRSNISNAYTTSSATIDVDNEIAGINSTKSSATVAAALPIFQNYTTTTSTTNNYSVNILSTTLAAAAPSGNDAGKSAFALQNPYTAALQASASRSNSQDSNSPLGFNTNVQPTTAFPSLGQDKNTTAPQPIRTAPSSQLNFTQTQQKQSQQLLQQQPIAFANTNPYAQIYPNLFAQAAAAGTGIANPMRNNNQNQPSNSQEYKFNTRSSSQGSQRSSINDGESNDIRSCSIKISHMCNATTYSDLRKFFSGLFIPHNGIKMINDKNGVRTGIAYIQFSRSSCVAKAMVRNNTFLKTKRVNLEVVTDEEFQKAEDSYKPHRERDFKRHDRNETLSNGGESGRGGYDSRYDSNRNSPPQDKVESNAGAEMNNVKQFAFAQALPDPFNVLYIEDIPTMASELDIMKMFSVYTIFDILLTVSPENRREFTAYVKFSREDEARAALFESSRHVIGHRKVRIRAAKEGEMEKAKEKLRLANEQLKKEEEATEEAAEKEECRNDNDENKNLKNDENDGTTNTLDMASHDPVERPNIPSIFDLPAPQEYKPSKDGPSDPRLRRPKINMFTDHNNDNVSAISENNNDLVMGKTMSQQFNAPTFNQHFNPVPFQSMLSNSIENNFVILKNCDYNTRINDVAQLMMSANLELKHIEPLRNERQMPTGEFIVEFTNNEDSVAAFNQFNNTSFRNRNLRVRPIQPQEIADRIGKPFMNYFPGGRGLLQHPINLRANFDFAGRGSNNMPNFRMNGGQMGDSIDRNTGPRFGNNIIIRGCGSRNTAQGASERVINRRNLGNQDQDVYMEDDVDQQSIDDDNTAVKSDNEVEDDIVSVSSNGGGVVGADGSGIPEKFNIPGCVIAMENVPFKADLKDIIEFFEEFDVAPDDIIRRFNDDGTPTGDARVAFATPATARTAYEAKKHKNIFNRTIYLNLV